MDFKNIDFYFLNPKLLVFYNEIKFALTINFFIKYQKKREERENWKGDF